MIDFYSLFMQLQSYSSISISSMIFITNIMN